MKPLVSVCVGTYNHKYFIQKCLDSILAQETTFNYEIILGEDESTDGTREICIEYAKNHPTIIKLFLRKRKDVIYINKKATGRYNFIHNLKSCSGKYIALCDGDDYWSDSQKLQKQVDFLEKNLDFNICFHPVKIFNQDEKILKMDHITRPVEETTSIENLLEGNYIHTPSIVFRNNFIIPNWLSTTPIGDWPLYIIASQGKKIKKLQDLMAVYRMHRGGIWSGNEIAFREKALLQTYIIVRENVSFNTKEELKLDTLILRYKNIINNKKGGFYKILRKLKKYYFF